MIRRIDWEVSVFEVDGDGTALRDGVTRIDDKVHEGLADLGDIHLDVVEIFAVLEPQIDLGRNEPPQDFFLVSSRNGNIHNTYGQDPFTAEQEDLRGQTRRLFRCLDDRAQICVMRVTDRGVFPQKFRAIVDDEKQVVEIVGDPTGELPQDIELPGLK